jgi:hypothetical protein
MATPFRCHWILRKLTLQTSSGWPPTIKLREYGGMLGVHRQGAGLAAPKMGNAAAIDGSDASWSHRSSISTHSGGHYGFKVHVAVDTATGLPIAWHVETAKDSEIPK